MNENSGSVTALIAAFGRAYHSANALEKIFDDFLAKCMLSEEEHEFFSKNLTQALQFFEPELAAQCPDQESALACLMQKQSGPITLSRAKYTEDCLFDAIRKGVQQYVILGAGMDTFAFRYTELMNTLDVFELDHPSTQASKRQRIEKQGWLYPEKLHFIPVDFTKESMAAAIKRSGYDTGKASFFSWLGVTYYLTSDEVVATLTSFAEIAPKGSVIVFDYLDTDAFVPEKADFKVKKMQEAVKMAGEPMKTGFEPDELERKLENLGLKLEENLTPMEIENRFFAGRKDDYHAFPHINFAKAIVL